MDKRKIIGFALGPLLGATLSLISVPYIAWYFRPEDIGRNNIFQTFSSFSILLFVLGLDQAYVREYHESENRFGLFKACFVPASVLLGLALIATLPFASEISKLLYGEDRPLWYFYTAGCIILSSTSLFLSLVVRMQERGTAYSASQVLPKLVVLIIIIGYVYVGAERDFTKLLYANLVSISLAVLIFGWNTRSDWLTAVGTKVTKEELAGVFRFGIPLIGAGIAYWGLSATSTIALRTFSNLNELGIYTMAMNFAGAAVIFQNIFSTVWNPTVYKWVAANEDMRKVDSVRNHVNVVVCFIFALVGTFSWLLDCILPSDYFEIKYILVCCLTQPLLYTLSETTAIGLNIQRKSIYALWITFLSLLSNITFSVALVPKLGAKGAAIANALAYVVFYIARTELSSKLWRRIDRREAYPMVIFMVAAGIATALFGKDLPLNPNAIWSFILLAFWFYYKEHISLMMAMVKPRKRQR